MDANDFILFLPGKTKNISVKNITGTRLPCKMWDLKHETGTEDYAAIEAEDFRHGWFNSNHCVATKRRQKMHRRGKNRVVAEGSSKKEETGAEKNERDGEFFFRLIEPRGDEKPYLSDPRGSGDENGDEERHLQVEQKDLGHPGRDELAALGQGHRHGPHEELEYLGREGETDNEGDGEAYDGENDATAELVEMIQKGHLLRRCVFRRWQRGGLSH